MDPKPELDSGHRWQMPKGHSNGQHELRILNSFTRRKEPFVANTPKVIKWYTCGPTVYDVAHLGHARCYITFDIIRRILADYFGYRIFYVMNITDIDDKIIKRARSDFLYSKYVDNFLQNKIGCQQLLQESRLAMENYRKRRSSENDPLKVEMVNAILRSSEETIEQLKLEINKPSSKEALKPLLSKLKDVIADEQDELLAHTVTEPQIFRVLTKKYEQEFNEDMQRLNVLPPSALTRVSEYIDETGIYIKRLESNGFAYRSEGSVYFDTLKFDSDPKHSYAKLVREAFDQNKDINEAEGELSSTQQGAKKCPNDFALWKKSKLGEPVWVTQDYEPGRPGWHIECSVMASHLLGESIDIHSGGCDLKFPHHDNEIAQAEAYYNTGKNWVNYFIHSGHLTISGCKMSKSLKNFITIRQALKDYTSRQLRFAFLAHGWAETLDYSPNTMKTALAYEKTFKEFFLNVADTIRRRSNLLNSIKDARLCDVFNKWSNDDIALNVEFLKGVDKVDAALCDNFDTRSSLNALASLIKECNRRPTADIMLLRDVACYVERILNIFGADFSDIKFDKLFYLEPSLKAPVSPNDTGSLPSATNLKFVETLAQFRADIRRISKNDDPKQSIKQILSLCDTMRDRTLPDLGIRLEDREVNDAPYVLKILDPETQAREKALLEKREHDKQVKEEAARLEKLRLKNKREDKMKVPPSEMFLYQTDKYSKFDSDGIPTHDHTGKEISKSALKKLQRLHAEQVTRYSKYIADQELTK